MQTLHTLTNNYLLFCQNQNLQAENRIGKGFFHYFEYKDYLMINPFSKI